jgi:hypothetical protein
MEVTEFEILRVLMKLISSTSNQVYVFSNLQLAKCTFIVWNKSILDTNAWSFFKKDSYQRTVYSTDILFVYIFFCLPLCEVVLTSVDVEVRETKC